MPVAARHRRYQGALPVIWDPNRTDHAASSVGKQQENSSSKVIAERQTEKGGHLYTVRGVRKIKQQGLVHPFGRIARQTKCQLIWRGRFRSSKPVVCALEIMSLRSRDKGEEISTKFHLIRARFERSDTVLRP